MLMGVAETVEMTVERSPHTGIVVPGTSVLVGVTKTIHMPPATGG